MGTRGYATGVHCHIEISQSSDPSWKKNIYGIYCFNNEYDTDSCYFVDNTNIIKGNGGNWRTTTQIKIEEQSAQNIADQILYVGSKVKFDGIFKVDIIKRNTNYFGCIQLTGVPYDIYYKEQAKDYHWLPADDFTEVDKNGSTLGQDDIFQGGISYVLNKNIYEVQQIDIKTNSAKLIMNGHEVWVFSSFLYEI